MIPFKKHPALCIFAALGIIHAAISWYMLLAPINDHIVMTPDGYYQDGEAQEVGTGTLLFTFTKR